MAVVEFAQNVLGWEDAHTEEITQEETANEKEIVEETRKFVVSFCI